MPHRSMRGVILAALSAVAFCFSRQANAIDCGRAADVVEQAVCAHDNLRQADREMSESYFSLLTRTATDRELHDLLVADQRRWIVTEKAFGSRNVEDDQRLRNELLSTIEDRAATLKTAANEPPPAHSLIANVLAQRKLFGAFLSIQGTGIYRACDVDYGCMTTIMIGNRGRLCGISAYRESHRLHVFRVVAEAGRDAPVLQGLCFEDNEAQHSQCPVASSDGQRGHWQRDHFTALDVQTLNGSLHAARWKYDPSVDPDLIEQGWLLRCSTGKPFD